MNASEGQRVFPTLSGAPQLAQSSGISRLIFEVPGRGLPTTCCFMDSAYENRWKLQQSFGVEVRIDLDVLDALLNSSGE